MYGFSSGMREGQWESVEIEGRFGGELGCVLRSLPPRLAIPQFLEEMRVLWERAIGVMLIVG